MEKLTIEGGPKAVTNKLVGWPNFSEEAIQAVVDTLRSGKVNYWTGRKGMEFEKQFAEWQGSKYAISVATGTAALHVALAALGIGPGDEVIVPSYTFIATSFSVVQAGAIPRFADVNLEDHCISVESAEKLVTKRTKAIMPVHLYGNVCDMDKIMAFAKKHNLFVIEDNAEAFGGVYKGKKTGTLGHIAGCSFCQNKTFTTGGEGGMVTTDDEDLAWKARSFRDHGYDVKQRLSLLELEQKLPYIHNLVGWNYRMTEMQSAIGLAELERMDTWNMPARRRNAQILIDALRELPRGQVLAHRHAGAAERLVRAGLLAGHREDELRHPAVRQGRRRRGRAVLEGLLAAVPHRARLPRTNAFGRSGLPVHVEGIHRPRQRRLQQGGGAQRPLARRPHLHLLRLSHLHRGRHAPDRRRAGEGDQGLHQALTTTPCHESSVGCHRFRRHRAPPDHSRGTGHGLERQTAAVVDVNAAANQEVAAQFGAQACASVEELLASGVDAVYIATPVFLHCAQTLWPWPPASTYSAKSRWG